MGWFDRLLNIGRTGRVNREIDRELAFHVAETAEALEASGMPAPRALREARHRLGNAELQRELTRDEKVVGWLESLVRDVRHALRGLVRAPVFALVAVSSLALGIGANTAVFTLLEAVVLRPLPVPDPEQLVAMGMGGDGAGEFTNPLWEQIRDRQNGFTAVAAFAAERFTSAAGGEPRSVAGAYVSGDYFRLFGVRAQAGRVLAAADDVRGCPPTVVLGHGFWHGAYGGDRTVVGRTLELEGAPFEIVGVVEAGFGGAEVGREVQVYAPLCAEATVRGDESVLNGRKTWWLTVMGRRGPGLTLRQAGARLAAIAPSVYAAGLDDGGSVRKGGAKAEMRELTVTAGATGLSQVRDQYDNVLFILMAGVALVLLIACANVANLLLARATAREREFAIRAAIGAGRGRLVRQLVTESLMLTLLGGVLAVLLARWGARALIALQPDAIALDLSLNPRVLGFTSAVAVATALLFGLVPAWRGGHADPHATLIARGRGIAEGHGRFTLGKALVAAQVALSLVLLAGAGLLTGSLRNLVTLDPGFTAEGVLTAAVDAGAVQLTPETAAVARVQLLERLRALPGVRSASTSALLPIGRARWNGGLVVDGFTPKGDRDEVVWFNEVSDGYFGTLETRLLAGRDFAASDAAGGTRVAIVTEGVARKFFGGVAIGKRFRMIPDEELGEHTIVGVVEDAKYSSLREEKSETVFLAASQGESRGLPTFELRTTGDPDAVIPAVRAALAEIHPALSVQFSTLSEQVGRSLQRERTLAVLSAAFGGLALALAVLGLYGVMAYTVARRRNEIGVRIALGARDAQVLRLVLGDTVRVVAIGLTAGLLGAVAATRLVSAFLFGLSPTEPAILWGAAALLASVALAAGVIPAWRATRMNPTETLREE